MKRRYNPKRMRAMTLTELMIAIALFAVVASIVLSFILYMSEFNKDNLKTVARAKEQNALRQAIDFWFSALDREEYVIYIDSSIVTLPDGGALAYACLSEDQSRTEFGIYRMKGEEGAVFVFTYPSITEGMDEVLRQEIVCEYVSAVYISRYGGVQSIYNLKEGEHVLNFFIKTVVNPDMYLCDIIYS